MANTFVKIQTVTAGSAVASIDFTSIPQTYTDLYLVHSVRATVADYDAGISINGSSANMTARWFQGSGTTATSSSGAFNIFLMNSSASTASVFSNGIQYFPNYRAATFKAWSSDSVAENNAASGYQRMAGNLWSQTAAITSLSLFPSSGSFVQYSSATLYGIKNT